MAALVSSAATQINIKTGVMENTTRYQHTQTATALLICIAAAAVLCVLVSPSLFTLIPLGLLVIVAILFCSLTIRVSDTDVYWHFGPGFWKKSVAVADIRRVRIVKTRWYYGLGIRLVPSGWLYTVSGLTAVELTLHDGGVILLGSDDADNLKTALNSALLPASH